MLFDSPKISKNDEFGLTHKRLGFGGGWEEGNGQQPGQSVICTALVWSLSFEGMASVQPMPGLLDHSCRTGEWDTQLFTYLSVLSANMSLTSL